MLGLIYPGWPDAAWVSRCYAGPPVSYVLDPVNGISWPMTTTTTTYGALRTVPIAAMVHKGVVWTAKYAKHWQLKVTGGTAPQPFVGVTATEDWAWIMTWTPRHPSLSECVDSGQK